MGIGVSVKVPDPLQSFVKDSTWTRITMGKSLSDTFRLDRAGQSALYLKVSPKSHWMELLEEKRRIDWLQGRLPVPQAIAYEASEQGEYLLLTALPGRDAASLTGDEPNENIVRLLAAGLRMVHEVPMDECPFNMMLDREIEKARYNVVNGLVDEADFDDIRMGRTAAEVFDDLLRTRPTEEDLVFTHGDYCLPNVMIGGEEVTGFVDWGRAGVADRYKDISLVVRSLKLNTGEDFTTGFFQAYGIMDPDAEKVEYYMLLDEFW